MAPILMGDEDTPYGHQWDDYTCRAIEERDGVEGRRVTQDDETAARYPEHDGPNGEKAYSTGPHGDPPKLLDVLELTINYY